MKNINFKQAGLLLGVLLAGLFLGWLLFGGEDAPATENAHDHAAEKATTWSCSMHPQIQKDGPGKCPLCGMDLVPMSEDLTGEDENLFPEAIPMSASAMKLAEIQTLIVQKEKPEKEIRLLGKVKPDQRLVYSQTTHISGRIEKLYINFTGEKVRKGQKLASIYSPDLVTAQKELLEVLKGGPADSPLAKAIRNKLKLWKLSDAQIQEIEQSKRVKTEFDILSNFEGYVSNLKIAEGDHLMEGMKLFEIMDLSRLWVLFEAYENDLPWVKTGDKIEIEFKAIPGKVFKQQITFIDPFIDPKTRVAYLRVELANPDNSLKPEMFAGGIIRSGLPIKEPVIVVPKSAVLWMGKRAVVYVKIPESKNVRFLYREVVLGEDVGEFYVIKEGLEPGEEIATNGVFKIDAAAQLSGKKSMMNPGGGKKQASGADKSKISSKFKKQLGLFVRDYLAIKNELAGDESTKIKKLAGEAQKSLKNIEPVALPAGLLKTWTKAKENLQLQLKNLTKIKDLAGQRAEFVGLSGNLLETVQIFGAEMPAGQKLYSEFCPMADNDKGAYWLSTEKEIKNPFFGKSMHSCGEVKEEVTDR